MGGEPSQVRADIVLESQAVTGGSEKTRCHPPSLCLSDFLGPLQQSTTDGAAWSNRSLFSPSSGTQKSEVKVSQGHAPSGGPRGGSCLPLSASGGFRHSWAWSCISPGSAITRPLPVCLSGRPRVRQLSAWSRQIYSGVPAVGRRKLSVDLGSTLSTAWASGDLQPRSRWGQWVENH